MIGIKIIPLTLGMKTIVCALLILCSFSLSFGQIELNDIGLNDKHTFYASWGYNRGWYTKSDIKFRGSSYDFILQDVVAVDKPEELTIDNYLNPSHITIPQYNARIGYHLNDKYDISLGIDHMKYVVIQNQEVNITGSISGTDSGYDDSYNDQLIKLRNNFLQFEHTDGLNFINVELRRKEQIISADKINIHLIGGFGLNAITPRSAINLLNFERFDKWILSGYGINVTLGAKAQINDHFFLQTELKGGYVDLPYIRSTPSKMDLAMQNFFFSQWNITLGSAFRIKKKKRKE